MDPLQVIALDIIQQLGADQPRETSHREDVTDMAYRGEIPTQETTVPEQPQPAYYVIRAREYETMEHGPYSRTERIKKLDLKIDKFDRLEDAQLCLENLVRGKHTKNELCALLYGYVARPEVQVKTETITHVNTSFKPV